MRQTTCFKLGTINSKNSPTSLEKSHVNVPRNSFPSKSSPATVQRKNGCNIYVPSGKLMNNYKRRSQMSLRLMKIPHIVVEMTEATSFLRVSGIWTLLEKCVRLMNP